MQLFIGILLFVSLLKPTSSSCDGQPTVWQLHWLVQRLVVAWLEASWPQQHELITLLDEGVCRRVDRALAAAMHTICSRMCGCFNALHCTSSTRDSKQLLQPHWLTAHRGTPEVVHEAEGNAVW